MLRDTVHPPVFRRCDLRNVDAIQSTFAEIAALGGPIDILVNNAGNDDRHELGAVTSSYWDERIAVNLKHQFFCAQAVAAGMREIGRGVILNLGSVSWHLALPNLAIYMSAKAAHRRAHARPRARSRRCRHPRKLHHSGRGQDAASDAAVAVAGKRSEGRREPVSALRIEPEHVARMALFLASDDASRCSGRDYFVDAGWYGE